MNAVILSRSAPRRDQVPDRLRGLARQVERQGVSGRTGPEQIMVTKLGVAHELRATARELEQ